MSETENEKTTSPSPASPETGSETPEETAAGTVEASAPDQEPTPADAEPASPEPSSGAQPQAQSEPKRKRKRLPRLERPRKTRPTRPGPSGRKPLVRQPKPESERGRRQERRGVVVSDAMDQTIVVRVDAVKSHPRYKKVVRRSVKFHAHDARNEAKVGDIVRIVETRPLSKTKNWRLAEVVEAAK